MRITPFICGYAIIVADDITVVEALDIVRDINGNGPMLGVCYRKFERMADIIISKSRDVAVNKDRFAPCGAVIDMKYKLHG